MNDSSAQPRTLDRYEILDEIAQGAMGVVYKARDPLIDRIVAIKTIALGMSDAETEAYERRFFREAKSAGRLNHPNVVTIFDVGKADGVAYIAMEFLDGQSLREIMDSGVVLPPQRIADIAAGIAEGLAFAHDNGVVHRDVKPANVMVLASGAVKITDFGIALLPTGTRTVAGNAFGSPRYTSPEQVMGRPVDGRSDIFSLGATLYEMLTGASPFQGGDLNTILKQVLSDPTPPPSSCNPRIPRAFDHIVGKALAKDPADRYQTAQAMAEDLRRFDALELGTAGPGPLPALEHPTTPFDVRHLTASAGEPLEAGIASPIVRGAADARTAGGTPATPGASAAVAVPWWQRKSMAFAALGALLVAIAVGIGFRDSPAGDTSTGVQASGRVAASNGTAAVTPAGPAGEALRSTHAPSQVPDATDPALVANAARATDSAKATDMAKAVDAAKVADSAKATDTAKAARTAISTDAATSATVPASDPTGPRPGMATPAPAAAGVAPVDRTPTAPASGVGSAPSPGAGAAPAPVIAAAAPKPTGRVSFAIAPWGEIYVDGRRRGIAPPLSELRLPAGKHVVEIRNATFPPHRETIDLGAGEAIRVRHKFQ